MKLLGIQDAQISKQARIPIISGLNIPACKVHLQDYFDKFLIKYLKFGFPLSLKCPTNLGKTHNHFSAISKARAVTSYIEKEIALGAMVCPSHQIDPPHIHFSPMLTRPKDNNKRRVILNSRVILTQLITL